MQDVLVKMEGIEKSFPGVHALRQCQFELRAGEVHVLMGENGAGKSTLMKVLTGVYRKDAGRVMYKGQEVDIQSTRQAQEMGIGIIFQEFNLMPHLTVAQNIFIGKEPRMAIPVFTDDKSMNRKTQALLDDMKIDIDATQRVSELTVAKQQMVEIAKALSYHSEVLIMDEPTAALTENEIDELFVMIHKLKAKGVGIVYISHRMEELKRIADRVTVMRDGAYIDTANFRDIDVDWIIKKMVGREIYESNEAPPDTSGREVVLKAVGLKRGRAVKDVSFELRAGEILGFAGLMGAGRTEVARLIFGADAREAGDIFVRGKKVEIRSPEDAVRHGIGYLSEDRKRYGLALGMDVETNIVMATYKQFLGVLGVVDQKKTQQAAQKYVEALNIKTPHLAQKTKFLSGGNQQKVIIGKWLTRDCDILIFDEPTRGIDVGAKGEIYKLLNELAAQGKSIIMISSELPEILRMSHRVIVMCEGRVTGEIAGAEATQEKIMLSATARE